MMPKKPAGNAKSAVKDAPCTQESICSDRTNQKEIGSQKSAAKTRITVKYDIGFGNTLYIRGSRGGLNWDKGIPMKNVKSDEWIWDSNEVFSNGEFKVLINDRIYEVGPNQQLHYGKNLQYTPKFR